MACIVLAALDQCLVMGMTYTYQIMQTQRTVAAFSATPISTHKDNRKRSLQVIIVSLSQITRCLDSTSDNATTNKAGEINSYS